MSVLIDKSTRLLVQGLTGREGTFHARQAAAAGTVIVGGVTPGKGGTTHEGWPIFNTRRRRRRRDRRQCLGDLRARRNTPPTPSWRPPTPGSASSSASAKGIPTLEMMRVLTFLRDTPTRLIGPNCPGVISPGRCKAGIIPAHICREGSIGIVSRSGTLTYEAIHQLTLRNLGQTTCIGIGGDPLIGTSFIDALRLFDA